MTLTEPTSTPSTSSPRGNGRRPGWLRPVRIVTAVVALTLIGAGAVAVAGTFFTQRVVETRSYPVVHALQLTTDNGDVRVHAAPPGSAAVVTATVTTSFRKGSYRATVDGGVLGLTGVCHGVSGWRVFGNCAVDFDIAIPTDNTVMVFSENGDLRVSGIDGQVVMKSTNGDVRADDVGGPVDLSSDNGDVEGKQLRGLSATAHSDNGDVNVLMSDRVDDVTATTSNGDVTVKVPPNEAGYTVQAETNNGDRSVSVPEDHGMDGAGGSITAKSSNGDVSVGPEP